MKIRLTSVLKTVAAASLISGVFSANAFAAGTGDNPKWTMDKPTAAQQVAYNQKMGAAMAFAQSRDAFSIMADGELKTVGVTPFKQETNYWCGPATTKQVLHYLNGSSKTQTYYAKELGTTRDGTDFSLVDDVLNDHQSEVTYVYSSFTGYDAWVYAMMYSVDSYHPAVLDLKIDPSYMPKYTSGVEGHILNNSGYDWRSTTKTKQLRLTDPFDQGGRGVTHGNVWHPMDGVWKANQAHFRKAVIW